MRFGDDIIFNGPVTGTNITIKSRLDRVQQTINAAPVGNAQDKAVLHDLIDQIGTALATVASNKDEVEAVMTMVKQLVEEVNKPTPNKALVHVNANGLKEAAETLKLIAPTVLTIATQIAAHITKIVGA